MTSRNLAMSVALLLSCVAPSAAQGVQLEFANGRVTLVAREAPARAILAEWARLGGTRIVNGDRVTGPPVTIELTGVPERQALDIVLRDVAGYMMTARTSGAGASQIDRIMILPASTPPRPAAAQPVFGARQAAPPRPAETLQDDGDDDDGAEPPAGRGRPVAAPRVLGGPMPAGETAPPGGAVTIRNGVPQTVVPGQSPERGPTAPPAGPAGAQRPANPFTTLPGSSRPGEVTPAPPPQDNRGPENAPGPQER